MDTEKISVLYVDDEENNLDSFQAVFRREYNVFTALSAQVGIEVLHQNNIPIIITDQRMPQMSGVEFLEKILPEFPDSVRIILTGYSDMDAIIEGINSGRIFRYLTKPWDEQELRLTLKSAGQWYDLHQKNKQLVEDLKTRMEKQERILKLFKKYVPPSVIEKTLTSPTPIFDGEIREVSVLFCDIRHFTEISASMEPKEVLELLNIFYECMSESVRKYNGSVNQFIGDEIFAVFGAPLSYPENESNAVFCALEMIDGLKSLNEKLMGKISQELRVGIGINSGQVIAGNRGTEDKIEYSVTGDTVNTGKRIEDLTKDFPNTVLINQSTYEKASDLFVTKPWPPVSIKGKKELLQVYQVLGRK